MGTYIYRGIVIALLLYIIYEVRNTQDKLKFDLEFIKSSQTSLTEGIQDVQSKLKYDLEFIKSNQSTLQENHDILVEILGKQDAILKKK